jgi:recombination protein RecA
MSLDAEYMGDGLPDEDFEEVEVKVTKPKPKGKVSGSLEEDFAREFGAGKICRLGSNEKLMDIKVRGSGSLQLDLALGGGYPHGRLVELRGVERSGKTTLLNMAIAEAQRNEPDKECAILDLEYTYNPEWARTLGVDTDRLFFSQPDTYAEKVFDMVEYLVATGRFSIIGIDSVAALVSKDEFEQTDWDKASRVGGNSQINAKAVRKIINTGLLTNSGTTLICVNQLRDKIGAFSPFGTPTDTPGGRALKFAYTHQLDVAVGEQFAKGTGDSRNVLGQQIKVKIAKNKIAAPHKKATLDLYYDTGLDKIVELVNVAKAVGVLQGTSWLTLVDPTTGEYQANADGSPIKYNGAGKTVEALNDDITNGNGDLYCKMMELVQTALRG